MGLMVAVVLLMQTAAAFADDAVHAATVKRVIADHIIPRFMVLKSVADDLEPSLAARCRDDTPEARRDLKAAFAATAAAWAAVDFYRFGALTEQGRRERMAFWPDPRGVVARQLRGVVSAQDPALLPDGAIAKQSAALQGLPALEILIADETQPLGPAPQSKFRCDLAVSIARNIAALANDMLEGWTKPSGTRDVLQNPSAASALYHTHAESAAELLRSLLTGLQAVAEMQVKPRLGKEQGRVKGPYAKLGLEGTVYSSAIQSLHELYQLIPLEENLAADKAWMKDWAKGAFRAMRASDGLGGAAEGLDKSAAPSLREVASRINGVRQLIGREMANAAGIAIGFNELDGD